MAQRTFQIAAIVAAVALVGAMSLTVIARSDGSGAESRGFVHHLHQLASHMHGGGHHHDSMAKVIEDLELSPDQLQRLERVHEIIGSNGKHENMMELHEKLMAQFEAGRVETDAIRGVIDDQLERRREALYAATDELVALVNGLDARQREILLTHIRQIPEGDRGHGL